MSFNRSHLPIIGVFALTLAYFMTVFVQRANYEFMIYVGVNILIALVVLATYRFFQYPTHLLWALAVLNIAHMAGGGVFVDGKRLYEIIIIPLSSTLPVLKYDQLVHFGGIVVVTFLLHYLAQKRMATKGFFFFFLVLAGFGVGAIHEIVEFIITVVVPETGVGGYENTMFDLVFNGLGAIAASVYLWKKSKR